ncbi:MAG TPA: tetratricopeptide repeat protein [Longimicrobiales bacterium]|nr:tetratricopeptide repeat protein [Longimicrobiales bacterium]
MPHGTEGRGQPGRVLWWLVLGIALSGTSSLAAQDLSLDQELSLKRDFPGSGPFVCPAVTIPEAPPAEERLQATQLASSADQALVQGDLTRAASLLERATELDPSSAELAYRRGRVLEDLGDRPGAIDAYCRVVAAGSTDYTATDAEARLQALADERWAGISDEAARAFRVGVSSADLGRFSDAARSFGDALAEAPEWADAVFNRAIMFDRMGRGEEALADLRRYLELDPDAEDAVAVSVRIGQLEGASSVAPSPGTALVLGLLVPGMGQFYSGRDVGGVTFLSLAGGALAAGFLIKDVEVECLSVVGPGQDCPAGEVYRENVDRPYLGAALAAAGGVAVIGAIEAFIKARRGGPALRSTPSPSPGELRLAWPSVSQSGVRVDFNFVRVTF